MGAAESMVSLQTRSDGAVASSPRTLWLLLPDAAESRGIEAAVRDRGWNVQAVAHRLDDFREFLATRSAPDLVVTALRLTDGDGLQAIRLLATLPAPPAVFLVSRQQRAVIKAALALATELGIAVAGFCERPGDAEGAADRLDAFVAPAPARRATDARPLERLELLDLLDRGAVVPWFQPKVRLASREVVGFEALMRARDAAGRLILPSGSSVRSASTACWTAPPC